MCRDSGVLSIWRGSGLFLAMWPSFDHVNWILAGSVLVPSMVCGGCLLSAIGESRGLAL